MLDTLITNKTRIKLLLRFFLNPGSQAYLRGLEEEFGESTNAIRIELNRFEAAGLLVSRAEKNRKMFSVNTGHPLYPEIRNILVKHAGLDSILQHVIRQLGNVESAYVTGVIRPDESTRELGVVIFGEPEDPGYLRSLAEKTGRLLNRPVRCTILPAAEEAVFLQERKDALPVWKREGGPRSG